MKVLITGGAGFIGCYTAEFYLKKGADVVVLDDLSRKGAEKNLEWLKTRGDIEFIRQDVSDFEGLNKKIKNIGDIDLVCHMAAQVAVTTSVTDPRSDFICNALGAFNILEAVRLADIDPVMIYTSTNKVYGEMLDIKTVEKEGKYQYDGLPGGISENRQLDFHSPYGCSKGCADQYFVDYSRIYGMKTVCMRQSCIYGSRQFGVEDQGWVAWFIIAAALNKPVTIYGDGTQVRDVLHVQDLVELYDAAYKNIDEVKGMAFNVGGGPENQMSLLELVDILGDKIGKDLAPAFGDWRPGDQKIYVSNIDKVYEHLKWKPLIDKYKGVDMLWDWVSGNKELFSDM